jgi:hypothetical protein
MTLFGLCFYPGKIKVKGFIKAVIDANNTPKEMR